MLTTSETVWLSRSVTRKEEKAVYYICATQVFPQVRNNAGSANPKSCNKAPQVNISIQNRLFPGVLISYASSTPRTSSSFDALWRQQPGGRGAGAQGRSWALLCTTYCSHQKELFNSLGGCGTWIIRDSFCLLPISRSSCCSASSLLSFPLSFSLKCMGRTHYGGISPGWERLSWRDGCRSDGAGLGAIHPQTPTSLPGSRWVLQWLFNGSKMSSSSPCLYSGLGSGSWWTPALRGYRW